MLLVVDNGSVYTRNLADLLRQKEIPFETQTPRELDLGALGRYDGAILSGRRRNEKEINQANSRVIRHAIENGKKLLGICYGAEILALVLGGTIKRSASPRKGEETVSVSAENPISEGSMTVFESHGFEIARLPDTLVPLAGSENCRYEIIGHAQKPVFGTQFHPEMSRDGHELIERFCSL